MGNTARLAMPYPEGTDRVMDGDNSIRGIAETLDSLSSAGLWRAQALATGALPAGGAVTTLVITYPAGRFPSIPQSIMMCMAMNSNAFVMLGVGAQSINGFTAIGGSNTGTGSITGPLSFYWMAVCF